MTSPTCRTIEVSGFLPLEIDVRVREVHFVPDGLQTTIIYDGWRVAGGRHSRRGAHAGDNYCGSGGSGDNLLYQP